jgi:hypothetical protein
MAYSLRISPFFQPYLDLLKGTNDETLFFIPEEEQRNKVARKAHHLFVEGGPTILDNEKTRTIIYTRRAQIEHWQEKGEGTQTFEKIPDSVYHSDLLAICTDIFDSIFPDYNNAIMKQNELEIACEQWKNSHTREALYTLSNKPFITALYEARSMAIQRHWPAEYRGGSQILADYQKALDDVQDPEFSLPKTKYHRIISRAQQIFQYRHRTGPKTRILCSVRQAQLEYFQGRKGVIQTFEHIPEKTFDNDLKMILKTISAGNSHASDEQIEKIATSIKQKYPKQSIYTLPEHDLASVYQSTRTQLFPPTRSEPR